jgi:hypothetical protein
VVRLRHSPECIDEADHGVAAQPVDPALAIAPHRYEARPVKVLEVLGGVGDRRACQDGKGIYGAFTLGEVFKELQAMAVRKRACHHGKGLVQHRLGA